MLAEEAPPAGNGERHHHTVTDFQLAAVTFRRSGRPRVEGTRRAAGADSASTEAERRQASAGRHTRSSGPLRRAARGEHRARGRDLPRRDNGELRYPQSAVASVPQILPRRTAPSCAIATDTPLSPTTARFPARSPSCMKDVGLIDHSDYGVLETARRPRVARPSLLLTSATRQPGQPGTLRSLHAVWYLRLSDAASCSNP